MTHRFLTRGHSFSVHRDWSTPDSCRLLLQKSFSYAYPFLCRSPGVTTQPTIQITNCHNKITIARETFVQFGCVDCLIDQRLKSIMVLPILLPEKVIVSPFVSFLCDAGILTQFLCSRPLVTFPRAHDWQPHLKLYVI